MLVFCIPNDPLVLSSALIPNVFHPWFPLSSTFSAPPPSTPYIVPYRTVFDRVWWRVTWLNQCQFSPLECSQKIFLLACFLLNGDCDKFIGFLLLPRNPKQALEVFFLRTLFAFLDLPKVSSSLIHKERWRGQGICKL